MPTFTVPNSLFQEFNRCHSPEDGKFCSGAGFLAGEVVRARKLGVGMSVRPDLRVRDSGFYPRDRRVEVGLDKDEWNLSKGGVLSVARHELGHATDTTYGQAKAQRIIDGKKFGKQYAEEFGAWRAAVRDSPFGRVNWRTVRQALTNYLYDDFTYTSGVKDRLTQKGLKSGPTTKEWRRYNRAVERVLDRTLDRHVTILRRYARHVRRGKRTH